MMLVKVELRIIGDPLFPNALDELLQVRHTRLGGRPGQAPRVWVLELTDDLVVDPVETQLERVVDLLEERWPAVQQAKIGSYRLVIDVWLEGEMTDGAHTVSPEMLGRLARLGVSLMLEATGRDVEGDEDPDPSPT